MEAWLTVVAALCIAALVKALTSHFSPPKKALPPGPAALPLIGNLVWLRRPVSDLEHILRHLKSRFGPLITMRIGSRPLVFVGSHSLAHQALVQHGAVFSDRPGPAATSTFLGKPQKTISSSAYGPTWRLLRRNLTQEILHPSRIRAYSAPRRWVLSDLVRRLLDNARAESSIRLIDHFQYAMFCLLVFMCFGDKLREDQIREIESVQRALLLGFQRFQILNFWPRVGRILFRNRWNELIRMRDNQDRVLIPLIRARLDLKSQTKNLSSEEDEQVAAYVDTLADLRLSEEDNRKLHEEEMVSLCSEFLSAGTDTTSTSLQWTMANLVKYPDVQNRLYQEIIAVKGNPEESEGQIVEEDDLWQMPYLKAVVLEALRRHPPGHFVLPHKVTQDIEMDGYSFPQNMTVNFMVADMGWDPKVWEDPMEFKPERFLKTTAGAEAFDITGSKEIKMMPFGAGRRICPGWGLALLHLEYFVANLIWRFEWGAIEGDGVDLSEKQEFTIVMMNPLRARISPRL